MTFICKISVGDNSMIGIYVERVEYILSNVSLSVMNSPDSFVKERYHLYKSVFPH